MTEDWLLGAARDRHARDRLLAVASSLIVEKGIDGLDVSELARRAHCSRATVYRHVGGRAAIIEAVLTRSSARIVEEVAAHVEGLTGRRRVIAALTSALAAARRDRIASQFFSSGVAAQSQALIESQTVSGIAAELIGLNQPPDEHVQLAVRVLLSFLWWPAGEGEQTQLDLLADFVADRGAQHSR